MNPINRQQQEGNLPPEEIDSLKELICIQKERIVIIKAADKGAGIVVLDFENYLRSCYGHVLLSIPCQNLNKESNPKLYYKPVMSFLLKY